MSSLNKVMLIGHLGKDPEIRYIGDKTPVAKFTVATSESYRDKNGNRVDMTEWHTVIAWRGLAEIAEKYLKKGRQVYVEGKLKTRAWDDKDGHKRYTTEIVADTFQMLGKKEETAPASRVVEQEMNPVLPALEEADDLPF